MVKVIGEMYTTSFHRNTNMYYYLKRYEVFCSRNMFTPKFLRVFEPQNILPLGFSSICVFHKTLWKTLLSNHQLWLYQGLTNVLLLKNNYSNNFNHIFPVN